MSEVIMTSMTREDMKEIVREVFREEMSTDKQLSQEDIACMYDVTITTVQNWERRGKIKRITLPGKHPRYSANQVKQAIIK